MPPSIYNDTFSNYNCTLKVPEAGKDTYKTHGVNGTEAGAAISRKGQAQVNTNLSAGSVAIVKIGERSVKVVIK